MAKEKQQKYAGIRCNECYRRLTQKQVNKYPTGWRYSGDMYCKKHETREQFQK